MDALIPFSLALDNLYATKANWTSDTALLKGWLFYVCASFQIRIYIGNCSISENWTGFGRRIST